MLAQVFGPDISQLVFGLDIVDTCSAFPHQLLDEEVSQHHVLDSRTLGPIFGAVQSQGVIEVQRYAFKARAESQFLYYVPAEHHVLHCQRCGLELCLHRELRR